MADKYAFLFPGQGAQTPGMLKDVVEAYPSAKKVIADVSSIININMEDLLWNSDAETLSRSDNSQIAITAASLAVIEVLKEKGIEPSGGGKTASSEKPDRAAQFLCNFEITGADVLDTFEIVV